MNTNILNDILKGYIEAALWTEEERLGEDYQEYNDIVFGDDSDEKDELEKIIHLTSNLNKKSFIDFTKEDIEDNSLIKAYTDIKKFIEIAGEETIKSSITDDNVDAERIGHDIWLTRNGHGAGFFDGHYSEDNENRLMNASKEIGGVDLFVNDNYKLSFSNENIFENNINESKMKIIINESQLKLLTELSGEEIYDKYYNDIDKDIYLKIINADPKTKIVNNEIQQNGKYSKLLLNLYKKGNLLIEDLPKATEYLTLIYTHQIPVFIDKIKTLPDLLYLVKPYLVDNETDFKEILNELKPNTDYKILFKNSKWTIYQPLSERGACHLGVRTEWCTTYGPHSLNKKYRDREENQFDYYNKKGVLYIIINNENNEDKYQFHFEDNQFKDVDDSDIDIQEFFKNNEDLLYYFFPSFVREVSDEELKLEVDRYEYLPEKDYFHMFSYLTPKQQMYVVRYGPEYIQYIKNPTPQAQMYAIKKGVRFYSINNLTPKLQMAVVKEDPEDLQFMENPTPQVQMYMVKSGVHYIEYISNPTDEVQDYILKNHKEYIFYIKNPNDKIKSLLDLEEYQMYAVEKSTYNIKYIKNPTPQVQMYAVKKNPSYIQLIKNPTDEVQDYILDNYTEYVKYIKNPNEKVKQYKLNNNINESRMKILVNEEDLNYIKESINSGEVLKEDLRRWFKEKWVDVSKKVNGKYPPCGRKDADGKSYPKCRPSKKISKETPKIASSYNKKEKAAMTQQKRRAERNNPKIGKGNKPTMTHYNENKELKKVICNNCGWKWDLKDGGDDPYVCHKCHNDNSKKYKHTKITITEQQLKLLIENQINENIIYEDEYGSVQSTDFIVDDLLNEAEYKGRKVKLNEPFLTPNGPKKRSVYVKNDKGNVVKVNFGDPNMRIKAYSPKHRKSFRARHNCQNPGPKYKSRYWSCKQW
jgi:hypothetical protein